MNTYYFGSDAGQQTITARSANAAVRQYDATVKSIGGLLDKVEVAGGYITVEENGIVIARINQDGVRTHE